MKYALIGSMALALSLVASESQAEPLVVDHGRLYVQAKVTGASTEAMLDSSAETTLVDDHFAREAKLENGTPLNVTGAGGPVPARAVGGATIETLGVLVRPEAVVVTDLDKLSGKFGVRNTKVVLGRELFDGARLVVDIPGQTISVVRKSDEAAGERLQVTEHAGMGAVPVLANGVASQAELDFGNPNDVVISRALVGRLGLKAVNRRVLGRSGDAVQADVVIIKSLKVGGAEFGDVTAVVDNRPDASDLNLGTTILGRFRITTDYADKVAWLQPKTGQMANARIETSPGDGRICEYRTPIGSHLRTRVCRTKQQIEDDQSKAESDMHHVPMSGPR
jgi:predicted aspartyl protease